VARQNHHGRRPGRKKRERERERERERQRDRETERERQTDRDLEKDREGTRDKTQPLRHTPVTYLLQPGSICPFSMNSSMNLPIDKVSALVIQSPPHSVTSCGSGL
jgi:hypothetical protein